MLEPLRFEEAPGGIKLAQPCAQLLLDAGDRLQQGRARRHIVRVGVDLHEFQFVGLLSGERVDFVDRLDFVAEQADTPCAVLVVGRENLNHITAHAERAAEKIAGGALVLQGDELTNDLALILRGAFLEAEGHRRIGLDRADTVEA